MGDDRDLGERGEATSPDARSLWDAIPELAGRGIPDARAKPDEILLGKIVLEWKRVTSEQLIACLKEQERLRSDGRELPLGEVLVTHGGLSPEGLQNVLREQAYRREGPPVIPRYEIRERIGQGATAVVYRAWDRELDRPVAVKILRETAGMTEIARQRFKREGQAEGALVHPNVVAVYDAGEVGGRPYLVMELVEGQPLGDVMRGRKFTEKEVVALAEKAARGVAAAHAKGIVHRDLKPQNILMTPGGEPKVGDFGLAHLAESREQLTRTGATLGTPMYMAPEQVKGSVRDITPRTDVYALGAILYELLAGDPPHLGETLAEIYRKISDEEPKALRTRVERLSRDLETIIHMAMDKDPARRYPDAAALADDLARQRAGEPILARDSTLADRLLRKTSRHRGKLLSGAILVLLALGVALWARNSQNKLRMLEAPQLEKASGTLAWVSGDREVLATIGRRLLPGDALKTVGDRDSALLRYPDLSSVDLEGGVIVWRPPDAEGKRLVMERGTIWIRGPAALRTQPVLVTTPQATLELGEGEHRIHADSTAAILEVHVGSAKATRRKDGRTLALTSDQSVRIEDAGDLVPLAIVRSRQETFARSGGVDGSLVGHWRLEDGRGTTAADTTGHGLTARLIGNVQWTDDGSVRLDGKGSHIELPLDPSLNRIEDGAYSLSLWFKPLAAPTEDIGGYGGTCGILVKGHWRIGLLYTGGHQFVVQHYIEDPAVKENWVGTGTWVDKYPPGAWYHVASTIDPERGRTLIYIDGRERRPTEWEKKGRSSVSSGPWRVGALEFDTGKISHFAAGEFSDVRLYGRVLDAEEIQVVYRAAQTRRKK